MDERQTCMASELIKRLNKLVATYGDLPVYVNDPDTQWRLPVGLTYQAVEDSFPDRLEIKASYYGRPEGDICTP
jgi:hypothetical protein